MKIVPLFILTILLLASCNQNRSSTQSRTNNSSLQIDSSNFRNDSLQRQIKLRQLLSDSSILFNAVSNKTEIKFIPDSLSLNLSYNLIKKELFDKLLAFSNQSNYPNEKYSNSIVKKDSLLILTFDDKTVDTLTEKTSNHINYSIIGYWHKCNLLLVKYEDWEESDFYMISMTAGKYFTLSPSYKISPLRSRLISYSNSFKEPTYTSGFLIARFDDKGIKEEIKVNSDKWAIDEAYWLDENNLIANISIFDTNTFNIKETVYLTIKVKKYTT